MGVLQNIKPETVFRFFEKLCGIPHGSSDTNKVSEYLCEFAGLKNLVYERDVLGNVIIKKPGTQGYEQSEPVILQSHIDMVCEKETDCDIDFSKDGLRLMLSGNEISADKTTLGGDDGIGVAIMLAILDAEDIAHPPIEAVFTVDEEIGMLGAAGLDYSKLSAKRMLNLDSEEEGHLLVGCAGGATAVLRVPVEFEVFSGSYSMVKITVSGVTGGHSGVEINRQGANAAKLLGRLMKALYDRTTVRFVELHGGMKDNVIMKEASTQCILVEEDGEEKLNELVEQYLQIYQNEYGKTDEQLAVSVEVLVPWRKRAEMVCMSHASTRHVIDVLVALPNGVQCMSRDIEGLVQSSLNLGIIKTLDGNAQGNVLLCSSVRSSVSSEKEELIERIKSIADLVGGDVTIRGDYPAWEYKQESKLRELMTDIYQTMYGKKPVVEVIHAGLECGLFSDAISGLDCVSYGPWIYDIHTTKERLLVDSVQRVWEYTIEVLKCMK
ncbi:MAG: aminoacyl-histidine dipeptidase [Eubacteriales bacterium]|nr:aminoacyl-histidine dipeptidase [Lachnospiraceae bacterium]MDO5127513.1 aminoacyl-histidine dipeptidase [Eubacteriales bacterium]